MPRGRPKGSKNKSKKTVDDLKQELDEVKSSTKQDWQDKLISLKEDLSGFTDASTVQDSQSSKENKCDDDLRLEEDEEEEEDDYLDNVNLEEEDDDDYNEFDEFDDLDKTLKSVDYEDDVEDTDDELREKLEIMKIQFSQELKNKGISLGKYTHKKINSFSRKELVAIYKSWMKCISMDAFPIVSSAYYTTCSVSENLIPRLTKNKIKLQGFHKAVSEDSQISKLLMLLDIKYSRKCESLCSPEMLLAMSTFGVAMKTMTLNNMSDKRTQTQTNESPSSLNREELEERYSNL